MRKRNSNLAGLRRAVTRLYAAEKEAERPLPIGWAMACMAHDAERIRDAEKAVVEAARRLIRKEAAS